MIRYISLALILLCSLLLGSELADKARAKHRNMLCAVKLVRHIRSCIEGFNLPLEKIYKDFDFSELSSKSFISDVKGGDLYTALCRHEGDLPLPDGAMPLMKEFAARLGKSHTVDQLAHCDRYIARLERLLAEGEGQISGKIKTYYTLSLSGGVMLVLLFI